MAARCSSTGSYRAAPAGASGRRAAGTVSGAHALRQDDGSIVAVVRGLGAVEAGSPPGGPMNQIGVLLPSEESSGGPATELTAVQLPVLAQRWPGPLIDGFVACPHLTRASKGLSRLLPACRGSGRLRNGAYALQWWVFAAFAVAMAIRMARDHGRRVGGTHDEADEIGPPSRTQPT